MRQLSSLKPIVLFQLIDQAADYFVKNAQRIDPGVLADAAHKLRAAADRVNEARAPFWEDMR